MCAAASGGTAKAATMLITVQVFGFHSVMAGAPSARAPDVTVALNIHQPKIAAMKNESAL